MEADLATSMNPASPLRRALVAGTSVAGLAALLLVSNVPLCPFAALTGQPCPGCGLTRATRAMLSADFEESLRLHPLVFLIAPSVAAWLLLGAWRYVREGRFRSFEADGSRTMTWFATGLAASALVVWVARFFGVFGGPVPVSSIF